jgi:hypothetical protein
MKRRKIHTSMMGVAVKIVSEAQQRRNALNAVRHIKHGKSGAAGKRSRAYSSWSNMKIERAYGGPIRYRWPEPVLRPGLIDRSMFVFSARAHHRPAPARRPVGARRIAARRLRMA